MAVSPTAFSRRTLKAAVGAAGGPGSPAAPRRLMRPRSEQGCGTNTGTSLSSGDRGAVGGQGWRGGSGLASRPPAAAIAADTNAATSPASTNRLKLDYSRTCTGSCWEAACRSCSMWARCDRWQFVGQKGRAGVPAAAGVPGGGAPRDFGTTRFFRILGLEKQCSILTRICTLF